MSICSNQFPFTAFRYFIIFPKIKKVTQTNISHDWPREFSLRFSSFLWSLIIGSDYILTMKLSLFLPSMIAPFRISEKLYMVNLNFMLKRSCYRKTSSWISEIWYSHALDLRPIEKYMVLFFTTLVNIFVTASVGFANIFREWRPFLVQVHNTCFQITLDAQLNQFS